MAEPVEILLVEDYEPDVQLVSILLKKNRVTNKLHVVRDGGEALDFIFCRGAHQNRSVENRPGVVLMDIRLPKMDGWEVLRQLKEDPRTRSLPVIMLSGSWFEEDMVKARQMAALGCIPKPVEFSKLRELLTESGFVWLLMGQEPEEKR